MAARRSITAFGTLVCTVHAAVAAAQGSPDIDRKHATALRVGDGMIKVDGRLDEDAWVHASVVDDFVQKEPVEGAPPSEPMQVRFAYDSHALYVGARMIKRVGGSVQAPLARRDNVMQAEHIIISLDTFLDRRTAYSFGVTAAGVRVDRYNDRDDELAADSGYDPVWEARTTIDADGWSAELWIPFSQLRFNDQPNPIWGLNIQRSTPTTNEVDYWVPVPRTQRAWSSYFGELLGIAIGRPPRRIELLPYLAGATTITSSGVGSRFADDLRLTRRAGIDMKIGIGANVTLEATANPDFGQVEVDPAEVNLTAFETFFPEKRPFFLEGATLLNPPIEPASNFFYSRRVGAVSSIPTTGTYLSYPTSSTIIGAAKLSGRFRSGTSLGILGALTDSESATVAAAGSGDISTIIVAPRTAYGVARVQQQFGPAGSTASAMVTVANRQMSSAAPMAGLLARNAVSFEADTILRSADGEFQVTAYGGGTHVSGEAAAIEQVQRAPARYYQRPDQDYVSLDRARTSLNGYKAGGIVERLGGRHWLWSVDSDIESPGFEPNDIGRLRAADNVRANASLRYRETVPRRWFRNYSIGVVQQNEWNFGGARQAGLIQPTVNMTWNNFWVTQLSAGMQFRRADMFLTRGGPYMQTPRAWITSAQVTNSRATRTLWSAQTSTSADEDGGRAASVLLGASFRPGNRWQLSVTPSYSVERNTQQYVATISPGPAATFGMRYVFGVVDRNTYAVQLRLNYTFKPDLTFELYAEPFAASGLYRDIGELAAAGGRERTRYGSSGTEVQRLADGSLVVTDAALIFAIPATDFHRRSYRSNAVLRWEWRPGSTLFIVWQQQRQLSAFPAERVELGDMFRSIAAPGENILLLKTSFWLSAH
jgi:uncharacterized protein DUF5916